MDRIRMPRTRFSDLLFTQAAGEHTVILYVV